MKDPLEDLLSRADAALPPPSGPADLPAVVRRRARRATRLGAAAGVLLAFGVVAVVLRATHANREIAGPAPRHVNTASVAVLQAELRELNTEARLCHKTAVDLQRQLTLQRRAGALLVGLPDPIERVQEARNRAASILLNEAERLESSNPPEARKLYRNIVQLFPETDAAHAAAQHLNDGTSQI